MHGAFSSRSPFFRSSSKGRKPKEDLKKNPVLVRKTKNTGPA